MTPLGSSEKKCDTWTPWRSSGKERHMCAKGANRERKSHADVLGVRVSLRMGVIGWDARNAGSNARLDYFWGWEVGEMARNAFVIRLQTSDL